MSEMHRLLERQLRKTLRLAEEIDLETWLAQRMSANDGQDPILSVSVPEAIRFLRGVSDVYDRFERDLALCDRSLHLSSEELQQVNERLQRELASRERALTSIRQTANQLLQAMGEPLLDADSGELESLTRLMTRMVRQHEQSRQDLAETLFQMKRVIIEKAANAIITIDAGGWIRSFNAAAERLFGHAADVIVGQSIKRLIPQRLHAAHDQGFAQFLASGMSRIIGVAIEVEGMRADGTTVPIELTVSEMVVGGQRMFVGIMTDITLRKEAENRLRRSEATTRAIVESAVNGIVMIDPEGVIRLFNPAAERLFDHKAGEMIGRNVNMLMPSPVREEHDGYLRRYLETGERRIIGAGREVEGQRRDGSTFPLNLAVSELGVGAERMFVGILTDLTARKAVEQALVDARELADQANRMKGDFLANMSHEIRTPMNAIMGMTHLALQTDLTDKQKDYLGKIQYSARNLLGIVNDILDFSKIEAGKLTMECIAFRLDEVLEHLYGMIGMKAEEKGLDWQVTSADDLPELLLGDPLRLGQVLINLGNNAVKFTERGTIRIVVERLAEAGQRIQLGFAVQDTGIGVTEEQRRRLFQAFIQADASTTRRHGGTGLGLSICKRLVTLMGGDIRVESTLGAGSTFRFTAWFELPSSSVAQSFHLDWLKRGKGVVKARDGEAIHDILGARVLLVEDNPINRQVAVELLEANGLLVSVAGDGEAALAQLERERFELVLLDLQMPGMDGFEVARAMRRDPRFGSLPILAMTAHAMAGDRERCLDAGMNDHLAKPIDPDRLFEALVRWIPAGERVACTMGSRVESRLPGEAAIDRVAGLRQVGGKPEFYRRLLQEFRRDYRTVAERMGSLVASGEMREAMRLAHTLKGVAGALGARLLADSARELEAALRAGEPADGLLDTLAQRASRLWQEIDREMGESSSGAGEVTTGTATMERERAVVLVAELTRLLVSGHSRSAALLAELRRTVGRPADAGLAEIAAHVEEYEFEAALVSLNAWGRQWGLPI
ncbi:MAG: PAS domain S-box protein [Magnetococcales bacterium]|nr:PAS domain S-box protein [Magnetococcales bacterium]